MPAEWTHVEEAAALLGVSKRTVYRYLTLGVLEGRRVGPRIVQVKRDSIDKAIAGLVQAVS